LDNWGLSGQPLMLNLFHKFYCLFWVSQDLKDQEELTSK
jgi:hypothetical protein